MEKKKCSIKLRKNVESSTEQGLVISLPYCYLNTEVQLVVRTHYNRWQLIRNVGAGQASHRASLSASTAYTTVNKTPGHQVHTYTLHNTVSRAKKGHDNFLLFCRKAVQCATLLTKQGQNLL